MGRVMRRDPSPRALLHLGLWCLAGALALLIFMVNDAHAAKAKAPSTKQVTNRLHDAIEDALWDYGLLVPGSLETWCRPGTRGNATRRVRWWCISEMRNELHTLVWKRRVRVRAHRGKTWTRLDWNANGHVNLGRGWYVSVRKF